MRKIKRIGNLLEGTDVTYEDEPNSITVTFNFGNTDMLYWKPSNTGIKDLYIKNIGTKIKTIKNRNPAKLTYDYNFKGVKFNGNVGN